MPRRSDSESPKRPRVARTKRTTPVAETTNHTDAPSTPARPKSTGSSPAIASAAALPGTRVSWLWERRIPFSAVTLLAGDQAAGKSTFCGALAAVVTSGKALPDGPINSPASVLWLGAEEQPAEVVSPRLRSARANLDMVYFPEILASGVRRRIKLPRHAQELGRMALDLGAKLIVLDPITSHVESGLHAETGSAAREVLEALAEACWISGAAAVAIKHPRKGSYGPLIERVSGSREWIQVPRSVLYLASPDPMSPRRVLAVLKPGPPQRPASVALTLREGPGTVYFEWEGIAKETVQDLERDDVGPGERDALRDARAFLAQALDEGERRAKDLEREADEAGISRGTLRRAKDALGIVTAHRGGGSEGFWVWILNPEKPIGPTSPKDENENVK